MFRKKVLNNFAGKQEFFNRVNKHGPILIKRLGRCWLWLRSTDNQGYGRLGYGGLRGYMAHRLSYEFIAGKIPNTLELDHLCRNPLCVRPSHLEPVTHAENLKRAGKFMRRTHCRRGHALTPDNLVKYLLEVKKERRCRVCSNMVQRRWQHAQKK
jgi:hypothetical protein